MFSSFRNRFGIPGAISVIALVFAMFGGAYAASNSGGDATASAKKAKKGPRGPKGPKGATGAQGPAGPAGAQGLPGAAGAKGDTGATGGNGANGTNGKTVLSGSATPTAADGTVGDFYIETDVSKIYGPKATGGANGGWGSGVSLVGPDGDPGESVDVTLLNPEEGGCEAGGAEFSVDTTSATICNGVDATASATQTGTWIVGEDSPEVKTGAQVFLTSISFPMPLPEKLDETHVHFIPAADFVNINPPSPPPIPPACDDGVEPPASVENPEADPGHLCVFTQFRVSITGVGPSTGSNVEIVNYFGEKGASTPGALLQVPVATGGNYWGTYAVTAPEE